MTNIIVGVWCTLNDLYEAYRDCKKRKSSSTSYARFAANEAFNLYDLWVELNNHTYKIGRSDAFCVTRPKIREVFAAQFRDRIVHHLVMLRLIPLFESEFINDTYNCRVGKGTDYGITRVKQFMDIHKNGWILKCDLRSFFMSIEKERLLLKVKNFIHDKYLGDDKDEIIKLVELIILNCPENNCKRKGNINLWDLLDYTKTLFKSDGKHGQAIGNLTSQIFANYYLNDFDKLISNIPNIEYGRYVDDFVIVSDDKNILLNLIPKIRKYLKDNLGITLHKNKIYLQPVRHGVTFLGSAIKNGRIYAGNMTVGNLHNLVLKYNKIDNIELHLEEFVQRYNSYMGYLIHRYSYKIRVNVWNLICDDIKKYVYITNNYSVLKVRNEFKLKNKLINYYSYGKKHYQKERI